MRKKISSMYHTLRELLKVTGGCSKTQHECGSCRRGSSTPFTICRRGRGTRMMVLVGTAHHTLSRTPHSWACYIFKKRKSHFMMARSERERSVLKCLAQKVKSKAKNTPPAKG